MIIKSFDDHFEQEHDLREPCNFEWLKDAQRSNVITFNQLVCEDDRIVEAPLSLKLTITGKESFDLGRRKIDVTPQHYLLLNQGQPYSCIMGDGANGFTESLCVFIKPDTVTDVFRTLVTPEDQLLEPNPPGSGQPVVFFQRLYDHNPLITPLLFGIRDSILSGELNHTLLEEFYHILLERLLLVHRNVRKEVDKIPLARKASRIEIYKRLSWARDFIDSEFESPIGLHQIAEAASLSPHHFLRLFKATFGITPHQYLIRRRLIKAKCLVSHTDLPISQMVRQLGFESLGSFSLLFKRHFGASPLNLRKAGVSS